jgi:1-acyl-sn-glycerol-3-phosphate acyltransferase
VASLFYWFLKWIAIGPLLRVVFRPRVSGAENVPDEGPAILASNHLSYADWLFMPLTLPRRVTFVAKAEYFNSPGIKGWFQRHFFRSAGQVPIDRSGASAAEGAMTAAKRVLDEGDLFGIYPEGTRSHDGRLYRGKTGVARLALETGVPVKGMENDRYILRSITDEVMYEIMRLSGQEYVDKYAAAAKDEQKRAEKEAASGQAESGPDAKAS